MTKRPRGSQPAISEEPWLDAQNHSSPLAAYCKDSHTKQLLSRCKVSPGFLLVGQGHLVAEPRRAGHSHSTTGSTCPRCGEGRVGSWSERWLLLARRRYSALRLLPALTHKAK